ncbi:MAG TPA: FGGY-family carbohydrate kinase [Planctomycetaceae bacterium]|nr:FGGY-family carbohydrate kinase [Planctomycetaceae bacterium]
MDPSDHPRSILAVDLGSGGPKVAVVTERGEILSHARRSVSTLFVDDGGAEQNPHEWWRAVDQAVATALSHPQVDRSGIVAVSCTGQWSVIAPIDASGQPLMNAIHWMDSRGAPDTAALTDGLIKIDGYGLRRLLRWIQITGAVPTHSGADSLAHILYLKRAHPDIYARTHRLLEPMDYLNLRLTGRFSASYATIFPYLLTDNRDVTRVHYHDGLLRLAGVDRAKLPDLVPVDDVLGTLLPEIAAAWQLPPTTRVVCGTTDNQTAALGAGSIDDAVGYISVGTTSWLSCHIPFKKANLLRAIATMPSAIPGRNIVVAEQGAAGRCLEAVVERLLCADRNWSDESERGNVYTRLFQEAAAVPAGCDGLLFLPWLNGSGPPAADGHVRGGFINQTLRTGRAEAVRAVMEGIAFNLGWLLPHVENFVGRRFDSLRLVGGAAESDLWCQIFADILDRPIQRIASPRLATVRGAALHALMSLGIRRRDEISSLVPISGVFEPDPRNRKTYRELSSAFVKCYKRTRGLFALLNKGAEKAQN